MAEKCIDELVNELVENGIDLDDDGKKSLVEFGVFIAGVGKLFTHAMDDLSDQSKFDELATATEKLWDKYVAPHDFKFLDNRWESTLKFLLRSQLRNLLAVAYDNFPKAA